ncbi:flavanone 3-dioxygenase 2-like [Magnolia sinica]|uniref:flavanone 3-dioxygenase 2-like n=1 Tax=Magnolia sinica TaxID=86752 RepID=UPI00265A4E8F|nr:flavanone 3-dioxygenase 2-like [Magnolia sinica]
MAQSMLLSTGIHYENLPQRYVRPMSERPRLSEVVSEDVPIIDLGCHDKEKVVRQIGDACKSYGFFQVTNHGVSMESMQKTMEVGREFFHLPVEEKMRFYSEDPLKKIRLSTSSNVAKDTVGNWRDYLRLHCHPLEEFVHDWPSNPSSFKDVVSAYCKEIRQLGFIIMEAISESLGLEKNYIKMVMGEQGHHMAINYYPPCPEPELTYGLPGHTDPNAVTILLLDEQVAGLQVLKDGKWIAIDPCPNTLVVNLGDQIQALSNGRYKSVRHRAIVNSNKERISVASFLCPANDAIISPAKQLITDESPAMYKNFTYDEYYKKFWTRNLEKEPCLELFKG